MNLSDLKSLLKEKQNDYRNYWMRFNGHCTRIDYFKMDEISRMNGIEGLILGILLGVLLMLIVIGVCNDI